MSGVLECTVVKLYKSRFAEGSVFYSSRYLLTILNFPC